MNTYQIPWATLLSRALLLRTLPNRYLKKPKSVLEGQGSELAVHPPQCPKDLEFHNVMVTAIKAALETNSCPRIVFTLDKNDFYWDLAFLLTSHLSQIQNLVIEALQKYIGVPSIFSVHCCYTVVSLTGNAQRLCSWFLKLRGASESKLLLISFSHL